MLVIKDFATTTIASALTSSATSIVVSDASRLPVLSAGDHFDLVLQKFTDRNYVEIVRVSAVSGNTLTVARGRDGTMGRAFGIGDYAEVRLTVGVFSGYVAQITADKVDKDSAYVNQSLAIHNAGDLVGAILSVVYSASTGHGMAISAPVGVNSITPYIALRPLGAANAATQLKYTDAGSLTLVGGTRSASFGFIVSEHSFDSNGFPNAVSNDANNYINRARSKITAGNSGLHFLADAALNARRFGIQSGHSLASDASSYGILDLNPFGGDVRVNNGLVYHTGYMPTPAALGVLALSGGTMTGNIQSGATYRTTINQSLGFLMQRPGAVQPVGLGQGTDGHAVVGYGPENALLAYLKVGTNALFVDLGNGIKNVYHEDYLPTPAIIGAVPTSRTVNSKPLSSNISLVAADVGAAPVGFGLGTIGASLSGLSANAAKVNGFYGIFANTTDTPYGTGPSGSSLLSLAWGTQSGNQLFFSYTEDRVFSRRRYIDVMQPWFEFYTTAKKPTADDVGAVPYVVGTFTAPVTAFFDTGSTATQLGARAEGKDVYFFVDPTRAGIYSRFNGLTDGAMIACRHADDGRVEFGVVNKMSRILGSSILFSGGNLQVENTNLGLERAFVIERGAKRARLSVGQPLPGVYGTLLSTLNEAGNAWFHIGVSEQGKPLYHNGSGAYQLPTATYDAQAAGGEELYEIQAPAGAVAGRWYPVVVPTAPAGCFVKISTFSSGGGSPMNSNIFAGYVRAGGWSDRGTIVDGVLTQYQTTERSIASVMAPTESASCVVFYVEARAFPVQVVRTSAEVLPAPYTGLNSAVHGTSTFVSTTTPDVLAGTKTLLVLRFLYGSGPYSTQSTNTVYSGSIALGSGTGPTSVITAGVYGISGFLTATPDIRVTVVLVYDGGSSTQYFATAAANHTGFQVRYNGATGKWDCPASTSYTLTGIIKLA
jgi:hypothetical protein